MARKEMSRTASWKVRTVQSGLSMSGQPRLFTERRAPADRAKSFDPTRPPVIGDVASLFAVGPVWVVVELGDFGGRLEPIRIEIRGYGGLNDEKAYPLTAGTLRRIRPGELVRRAIDEHDELLSMILTRANLRQADRRRRAQLRKRLERVLKAGRRTSATRGQRPRETKDEFMRVIEAYDDAVRRGSRRPNVDAEAALRAEGLHLSVWTVRKYVARARKLGILAPRGEGRQR